MSFADDGRKILQREIEARLLRLKESRASRAVGNKPVTLMGYPDPDSLGARLLAESLSTHAPEDGG